MGGGLFNIVFTDYTGSRTDLQFLEETGWLKNTLVVPGIYPKNGQWRVRLIFAWQQNPFRFICRRIPEQFFTAEKAQLQAAYYTLSAAKDHRDPLNLNTHDFIINLN